MTERLDYHNQPEHTHVATAEYARGSGNEVLESGGMGPCIAVVLHDARRGLGYLYHSNDASQFRRVAESFLRMVEEDSGDLGSLKGWLRGGCPQPPRFGEPDTVLQDRDYLVEMLRQRGVQDIDIEWNDDPGRFVGVELNCQSGKFVCDSDNYDEFINL